jgi:hypothetical protein
MELDKKHKTYIRRKFNSTLMDQQKHAQKVEKQIPGI